MSGRHGKPYLHVTEGVTVPVPGGKTIEELFGQASTGTDRFSLARMVAPPGWVEPPQTPEFGELTIILRGRMRCQVGEEAVDLGPGESLWTEPGVRVQYGNPFDVESEYYAVCLPAFTVERSGREDGG